MLFTYQKKYFTAISLFLWMNFFKKIFSKNSWSYFSIKIQLINKDENGRIKSSVILVWVLFEVIFYKFYNKVVSMLIKDWNGKNKKDSSVSYKSKFMNASQFYASYGATLLSAETSRSSTNSQYNKFSWHQIFSRGLFCKHVR